MRLHEHSPYDSTERWRARSRRRQQHLVRSLQKLVVSTASAIIFGTIIGLNVIPTTSILRHRTNWISSLAGDPESATISLVEFCTYPVEWPRKRQRKASPVCAPQPRVDLIPTTPRKAKHGRCKKSVSLPSNKTGLFDIANRVVLTVGCTAKAPFEDWLPVDLVCNAKKPTDGSVLRVSNKHQSLSAFLQATITPTRHRSYGSLSMKNVQI